MKQSTCKFCGEPIQWGKTRRGKWVPLDPYKTDLAALRDGEKLLVEGGKVLSKNYKNFMEAYEDQVEGFVLHFSSCEGQDR